MILSESGEYASMAVRTLENLIKTCEEDTSGLIRMRGKGKYKYDYHRNRRSRIHWIEFYFSYVKRASGRPHRLSG